MVSSCMFGRFVGGGGARFSWRSNLIPKSGHAKTAGKPDPKSCNDLVKLNDDHSSANLGETL